jgi:hypothetical protein
MPLHITNDFLLEIGRIAVLQSHIDGGLAVVVANLAGVDDRRVADALTKPLSFRHLTDIATSLLKVRAEEVAPHHAADAADLIRRARKTEERRNEIVHSMWSYGPNLDPEVASRIKLSGSPPELIGHAVSIEEVRAIAQDMEEIVNLLTYIHPFLRRTTIAPPNRKGQ